MVRVRNICNDLLPLETASVLTERSSSPVSDKSCWSPTSAAITVCNVCTLLHVISLCTSSLLEHKTRTRAYSVELNTLLSVEKNPWKIKISGENTINVIILVYPMLSKDWSK